MVSLQDRTQRQTRVHMRQWAFSRLTHCIMEILNFKTTERVSSRPRKELMLQDMSRGSQLEHKGKESAVVKPLFIIYVLLMLFLLCCVSMPTQFHGNSSMGFTGSGSYQFLLQSYTSIPVELNTSQSCSHSSPFLLSLFCFPYPQSYIISANLSSQKVFPSSSFFLNFLFLCLKPFFAEVIYPLVQVYSQIF